MFGREWLFVGHRHELSEPGDYLACDIAGWPLVVVVDDEGGLRAHHNVCRHRAGPLVHEGCGRVAGLVCRYHGWSYGLDGRLRSARDFGAHSATIRATELIATWNGWLNGYVWPAYRGGPMHYADQVGLKTIRDKLKEFQARHGDQFKPSALLEKLADEGKGFSDL